MNEPTDEEIKAQLEHAINQYPLGPLLRDLFWELEMRGAFARMYLPPCTALIKRPCTALMCLPKNHGNQTLH